MIARLFLVAAGMAMAALAHIHAGSETGARAAVNGFLARTSVNAEALSRSVSGAFLAEMRETPTAQQGGLPRISDSLAGLARASFAVDPLEVSTVRSFALGKVYHDSPDQARQLMRVAARISKRDEMTNLWLARDYGELGDTEAMTASFDHVLRTSMRARASVMRSVVDLVEHRDSHQVLGELIARDPEWEPVFWIEFARSPIALRNAARFFRDSALDIRRMPDTQRAVLYANLKRAGELETLYLLANLDSRRPADGPESREPRFPTTEGGDPLGWTLHSSGTFAARVDQRSDELEIDARAGAFGVAADRVVQVEPSAALVLRMSEPVPNAASVEAAVSCPGADDRPVARVSLGPGEEAARMPVAAACRYASLTLSFTLDVGQREALLRVADVSLAAN